MKNLNLLVIGSYPPFGTIHDKAIVGGASYTKNTLLSIIKKATKKDITPKITVLAEELDSNTSYIDEDIAVERVWKKNNLLACWQLFKSIKNSSAKDVLLTFEFSMFGSLLYLLPLPFLLIGIKILGKRLHVVLHQVITDASSMSGHLNIAEKGLKASVYSVLFQLFYTLITNISTSVIVFEEVLKKRLGNKDNIVVIPHGVEKNTASITQTEARKKLGLPLKKKIVLCFGFLAWYKGTDWVTHLFATEKSLTDTFLVIAGGPNSNHMTKPFYQKYIVDLENNHNKENTIITGFVQEKDLPLYFKACDLALFPYRSLMASSGPLSLAFTFHSPFLLSEQLVDLAMTQDFSTMLGNENVALDDLLFSLDHKSASTIKNTLSDTKKMQKLEKFSSQIADKRSWETIGDHYLTTLLSYAK